MKFKLTKVSKETIPSDSIDVFDITVENNHSYCVNNIVVHNCGYPQLSAVIECADAAHGLGAMVMSDGGCRTPADVCKAFGAGADFVMLGGMLSGHDESPGTLVEDSNGRQFKEFYGMSSHLAQNRHGGGIRDYRSSEGREVLVPYRGPVQDTVNDILGGLRSCCAYCGASKLKELSKRTTFVRVSRQLNTVFDRNQQIN